MQVYIVIMLVPDDSDDNTQNMGVFTSRVAADLHKEQLESDGMDCDIEEWTVQ